MGCFCYSWWEIEIFKNACFAIKYCNILTLCNVLMIAVLGRGGGFFQVEKNEHIFWFPPVGKTLIMFITFLPTIFILQTFFFAQINFFKILWYFNFMEIVFVEKV